MNQQKNNLALVFGGRSGEHAVSLRSSRSVRSVLDLDKYNVFEIGITLDGVWLSGENALSAFENGDTSSLQEVSLLSTDGKVGLYQREYEKLKLIAELDVIFPVLHGTFGEDGTIQGLFEILNVAYVGAGVLASAACMDKAVCKDLLQNAGIPVLPYQVFSRSQIADYLEEVIALAEAVSAYPLFIKPANLGSSVGISKAGSREELRAALLKAARFDRRILVERGIDAREIEISVLGNDYPLVSVPGEIVPEDVFYTYKDKYLSGDPETIIPAPFDVEMTQKIQEYALRAYRAVDGAGLSRVDFLMDKHTGELFLSEINTMPGFTSISMYPKLWKASGLEYPQLVDRLITLGLERKADQDQTVRRYED
ncbi:MAG TPA: D-alanine--D-alanine ligase family protein [Anaerolineaceae bacterium]|jgi:D-alanine-D-alanine ligase|nr:D-alanine--D-alanine ligase family protein [Anaerolineaceae bacterium]